MKLNGTPNVKLADQVIRAKVLAELFDPAVHTTVRLMDGCGGFLLLFLEEMERLHSKNVLERLTIELVDIVGEVTEWHKKMFRCSAIRCLTEKIVDKDVPLPFSTLLYMNFCGIAMFFDEVCQFLKAHPIGYMLSFSLQRAAKSYHHTLIGYTSSRSCTWRVSKVKSGREDCATYVVKMKEQP